MEFLSLHVIKIKCNNIICCETRKILDKLYIVYKNVSVPSYPTGPFALLSKNINLLYITGFRKTLVKYGGGIFKQTLKMVVKPIFIGKKGV